MKKIRTLLRFNVDIVDHCNLNCKCCGHFSPLAKEYYMPIESFAKDCARLHQLTGGIIERMEFLGGEPLLHPDLLELIKIARVNFNGIITICTNGLLLEKMPLEFYKTCAENDIDIAITLYPIKLDLDNIDALARTYGTRIIHNGLDDKNPRLWFHNKRDFSGMQDIKSNFNQCRWGNSCILLDNGRLATCVMPLKVHLFNEYYKTQAFEIPESDSIDIYKVQSLEEIMEFLARPISCCRYCMPNDDIQIEWGHSKKTIEEWI